jgi:hypothetical protein
LRSRSASLCHRPCFNCRIPIVPAAAIGGWSLTVFESSHNFCEDWIGADGLSW